MNKLPASLAESHQNLYAAWERLVAECPLTGRVLRLFVSLWGYAPK